MTVSPTITAPDKLTPGGLTHRNNNFNFLRLLLACLVLLSHAPELSDGNRGRELLTRLFHTLSFGELAVDGFFVLSGYLIASSWQRKPDLRDFFEKRVRRIYPAFIVASLISIFILAPFGVREVTSYFSDINYRLLFYNLARLRVPDVPYVFAGRPHASLNGSLWSIEQEFRCYVIVAVVGLLGAVHQKRIWLVLFILSAGVFTLQYPSGFARLFTFYSAGVCFCLCQKHISYSGRWALVAAVTLFGLLFVPSLASLALATIGAYLLFWLAFTPIPLLNIFKRIDDISYGLYLYGWPIQKLLDWYLPGVSPWILVLIALPLAAMAGYMSWHLVEQPFLNKPYKTSSPPVYG